MGALTRRMTKVICLMAMAGFIVSLCVGEVQAKDYKWKISQGIAEDHPAAARCKQYAKLVEEKSGGHIKMTYFPSGALGDWMEQIEANRMPGPPPMTREPTSYLCPIFLRHGTKLGPVSAQKGGSRRSLMNFTLELASKFSGFTSMPGMGWPSQSGSKTS